MAKTIAAELRPGDLFARVGGDEFAAVLVGAGRADAEATAERLRAAVARLRPDTTATTTLSIGLACFPVHAEGANELLDLADRAMYFSKRDGRDRVSVASTRTGSVFSPALAGERARNRALAQTVHDLASSVDARDGLAPGHSRRVADYAEALARTLDALEGDELDALRRAAILRDVGKIGIADQILRKPSRLTAQEHLEMERHADLGAVIIAGAGMDREAHWVRHLHERWDGTGYPAGLAGARIPLASRILHAADALEAITSSRSFRPAQSLEFARFEIDAGAGAQFDPAVADALSELLRSERLRVPAGIAAAR